MVSASASADVLVCDAETDQDLFGVASASMRLERRPLWVGSAGLAYQLPGAAGIAKAAAGLSGALPHAVSGPALFVIGSLSRNSLEQVRHLASSPNTTSIRIAPHVLLAGQQHPEWSTHARVLQHAIRSGQNVLLTPGTEDRIDLGQRPLLAAALGSMVSCVSANIGALVASGGETARAVFDSLGITRLRLRGELEKGIPISVTEDWIRPLPVITKAGDFGGPDTLIKCSRYLHAEDRHLASPAKQER